MTEEPYVTFQKFSEIDEAEELAALLLENAVEVQIEKAAPGVDVTFSGNTSQNETLIKIRQSDFEKANEILEKQAELLVDQFPDTHYLFEFTDDELMEILEKPDEWSKEDHLLSQKILNQRGREISKEKVEELWQKRIDDIRKPEKGKTAWLVFGYISAILGGLLGMLIGWVHWTLKKTDPTGQQIFAYDEKTRKTGKQIFLLGVVFAVVWLVVLVVAWS